MRARLCALGILLLASACSKPEAPAKEANESDPAPAPSGAAQDAESENAGPQLTMPPGRDVSFEKEFLLVQQVRGLPQRTELRGRIVEEDDLIDHVEATFARELPQHALLGSENMLVALGVAPQDFDFEATMLDLLHQELLGLYDPKLNAMFVRAGLDKTARSATLYHELVHALQDQHYNLDNFSTWEPDATDKSSALSCLAEGGATSAMFDAMFRAQGVDKTAIDVPTGLIVSQMDAGAGPSDDGIPAIIKRSLASPYKDGLLFIHALRKKGGWKAVDAAWQEPPKTTEQVLHLDKFESREPPLSVPIPAGPSSEWQLMLSDVWGEQSLRLLLEEWLMPANAALHSAGWGGDRIALYRNQDQIALAWTIVADNSEAAARMVEGLLVGLDKQGSASESELRDASCQQRGALGPLALRHDGNTIQIVAGPLHRNGNPTVADCSSAQRWLESL